MRVLILLSIVALSYGEPHLGHRIDEAELRPFNARLFEGAINGTAECIRNLLANGEESIGLPPLDPLVIDAVDIDLDQYDWEHFRGKLSLKNFKAQGQLGWHISKLSVSPTIFPIGFKLTLTIGWNAASFQGGYNIDANILNRAINGNGDITGSANNFTLSLKVQGTLSSLKQIEIMPYLEAIDFHVGQLVIDGKDISELVNNNVNKVLHLIQDNLEVIGGRLATAILNILSKQIYTIYSTNYSIIGALVDCIQL